MLSLAERILLTLSYSAVFSFPLQVEEIWRRLIGKRADSTSEIHRTLETLQKQGLVIQQAKYWALPTHEDDFVRRRSRVASSRVKWQEAHEVVALLQHAPGILGIAVTGSVAVNNAEVDSDLDFMLVTKPHALWLCRVWVLWHSWRRGKRRSFAHEEKNSWCFNLWLTTEALALQPAQRSLYAAYEVCQAQWLWQREATERRFLEENSWVQKSLPQYYAERLKEARARDQLPASVANTFLTMFLTKIGNWLAFQLQYFYMFPHMTREVVFYDRAFFHPRSTKKFVTTRWQQKLQLLRGNSHQEA